MAYKYTREEWEEIKRQRELEDRAQAIAYAEDMYNWSALREEQNASKRLLSFPNGDQDRRAA
jgi:hypothetical protein